MSNVGGKIRVLNLPNAVTIFRLVFAGLFVWLLFSGFGPFWLLSTFALAAVTDFFDGYLARKLHQTSQFGAVLDQYVDRLFTLAVVASLLIYAVLFPGNRNSFTFLPDSLLLLICCTREILTLPAIVFLTWNRRSLYHVTHIGKVTTFLQSIALGSIILGVSWSVYLAIGTGLCGIASFIDYSKFAFSTRANS